MARIAAGDRDAEAELVERFARGLGLLLRRLGADPAGVDDLRQETLAVTLEKLRRGEIRDPERLAGFVRGIARNLWRESCRRDGRTSELSDPDALPAAPRRPLDRLVAEEEARQVQRLLGELRHERDREVLVRFYLGEEPREAICRDVGVAPEQFNLVLHRARGRLRELCTRAAKRGRLVPFAARQEAP